MVSSNGAYGSDFLFGQRVSSKCLASNASQKSWVFSLSSCNKVLMQNAMEVYLIFYDVLMMESEFWSVGSFIGAVLICKITGWLAVPAWAA